jgi:2-polyprenyl-3-methyl-5-hydroxy-6-metoxy-1,4-benzoquinol methylase
MMKIERQPEGNYYNKYESKNRIVKRIMQGFFQGIDEIIRDVDCKIVYEAGCGEGYVSDFIYHKKNIEQYKAMDISERVIDEAKRNFPHIHFQTGSIYEINQGDDSVDLVVATEVLEHLEYPDKALQELLRISKKYVFISVPNEPLWRICNFLRGKYVTRFGNSPGHIQHWSTSAIVKLASKQGKVNKVIQPFPWSMILLIKNGK